MIRMKTQIQSAVLLLLLAACSGKNMNANLNRDYNKKMDKINIATYDMGLDDGVYEDPNLFFEVMASKDLSNKQRALVNFGRQYLGATYVFGATNPSEGFDCSGYTQFAFKKVLDINLPRTAKQMAEVGMPVASNYDLKAGDLVFFNTRGFDYSHVGIYIGEGRFFHASTKANAIIIGDMATPYFSSRYNGARRILGVYDNYNTAGANNTGHQGI